MNIEHRQDIQSEVEAFLSSGLSVRAFCQSKPYRFQKLYYWLSKIRAEQSCEKKSATAGFSSLKVIKNTALIPASVSAEIVYPNGLRISLYEPLTASFLKSLL